MRAKFASLVLLASGPLAAAIAAHEKPTVRNANHIFNAIHSSMREWGSALCHNGMSFFLASVPAGTQLYHGTDTPNPTTGMEWLSFELEQAILFARLPPQPPSESHPPRRRRLNNGQEPLLLAEPEPPNSGWLHTYVAARDLRLLYTDGLSAAKTKNGTQDSQNRILLNDTIHESRIVDEGHQADEMCRIIRDTWGDRLDGVLRMEVGTEIILCSFERDLEFVRAIRAKPIKKPPPPSPDEVNTHGNHSKKDTLAALQPDVGSWLALGARYHGIGGNRVRLNYDHFVTAYMYDLDIFGGESKKLRPRLDHIETSLLEPMRQDLKTLVMTHDTSKPSFDWQAVTDMIIERYGRTLRYLASGIPDEEEVRDNIERLLEPFIEYHARNATLEADRCTTQFIPVTAPRQGTAALAVSSVAQEICWTLLQAWEADYETILSKISELMEYLSWTTWKECTGCKDNEMCMLPVAPMGAQADYDHPTCRDVKNPDIPGPRYWGGFYIPSPDED